MSGDEEAKTKNLKSFWKKLIGSLFFPFLFCQFLLVLLLCLSIFYLCSVYPLLVILNFLLTIFIHFGLSFNVVVSLFFQYFSDPCHTIVIFCQIFETSYF